MCALLFGICTILYITYEVYNDIYAGGYGVIWSSDGHFPRMSFFPNMLMAYRWIYIANYDILRADFYIRPLSFLSYSTQVPYNRNTLIVLIFYFATYMGAYRYPPRISFSLYKKSSPFLRHIANANYERDRWYIRNIYKSLISGIPHITFRCWTFTRPLQAIRPLVR